MFPSWEIGTLPKYLPLELQSSKHAVWAGGVTDYCYRQPISPIESRCKHNFGQPIRFLPETSMLRLLQKASTPSAFHEPLY
jgi:hypothetical protein